MALFSVSYDLNKAGQNYEALYTELKRTEFKHIMDSTWLISTSESAKDIYNRLSAKIDNNDLIFISKVNSAQYFGSLRGDGIWQWISDRV